MCGEAGSGRDNCACPDDVSTTLLCGEIWQFPATPQGKGFGPDLGSHWLPGSHWPVTSLGLMPPPPESWHQGPGPSWLRWSVARFSRTLVPGSGAIPKPAGVQKSSSRPPAWPCAPGLCLEPLGRPAGSPRPPRDGAVGVSFSPSHRSLEGPVTWCCPRRESPGHGQHPGLPREACPCLVSLP